MELHLFCVVSQYCLIDAYSLFFGLSHLNPNKHKENDTRKLISMSSYEYETVVRLKVNYLARTRKV